MINHSFRFVIFAAVSTKDQAADDRDSIPHQIKRAREIAERRGWVQACDPLIVPGQSRSIDFLHEAIEEISAIRELIGLARQGEVDLVIVRDYDRLARTRTLLTQISSYLSRCKIQIYAVDKPVEPVLPDDLNRRGRGVQSAAMIEALAGLEAEGEISRIAARHHFGMNSAMRDGRWAHSKVIYGYTRQAPHSTEDNPIYTDVPLIVPAEVAIVRRIEKMYMEQGMGGAAIARKLNREGVPSPGGSQWQGSTVLYILKSPFYCGYVTWGLTRRTTVFDADKGGFVNRAMPAPIVESLTEQLGHKPTVFDLLRHPDKLAEQDVYISEGLHEPVRSVEFQKALYAEIERRRSMGGRAASTKGKPYLFTGILFCGYCGARMVAIARRNTVYYACRAHRAGQMCSNKRRPKERDIYDLCKQIIERVASDPQAIEDYIAGQADRDVWALESERESVANALEGLGERRQRWNDAYEAGVIDMDTYSDRLGSLESEHERLMQRLVAINRELQSARTTEARRANLLAAVAKGMPDPTDANRGVIKAHLRRIFESISVRDGQIIHVKMR